MKALRAVGVALLSLVDALVPSVLAALATLFFTADATVGAENPLLLSAAAGGVVFAGTLTVGFVATLLGHGPFPATRATKRIWQWWHRPWFTGRRGRGR
ncbi:type I phosphoribosyltransferase [Halosimplex salinum]|uniref:hypothetical protein n=1 Tax=Halosimplex salinum TaxID=1710538 RepID=UPI000F49C38D|nr:hypothetical protein [Halosimplex salinum]